ncbi:MAG TPA: lysylphosphatidylglycerol synthase transmembrane domain-containing protein [Roseiflexaceae bacterium]|nr:lysylphosphatidylglycerol synthase transmembrane domain-containing protein [Roseiflexaceae bacterium]
MRWRSFSLPLRILVSGGLLVYLIWRSDPAKIWQSWQQARLELIVLAVALQFLGVTLSAAKWWVLLRARGEHQPFLWLLGAYLAGQFANNFLPTTVGGDALRIAQLGRRVGSYSQASASVFVERLTGFLALSLIANLALVAGYFGIGGRPLATAPGLRLITIVFMLAAVAAMAATFAASRMEQLLGPRLPVRAHQPLRKVAQALADYAPQGHWLTLVLGMSLLFQLLWVVIHAVCGQALGIEAPLLLYAIMSTVTDILGLAPIFLNNLGAREFVFTIYLAQVGVSQETALALAFAIFAVRLAVSVLGGLVALFGGADLRATRTDAFSTES